MNNTDMETFWAVLEHGTLTAAAEALFITQPTLTNRIQSLEAEVGAQLFHRGKGIRHIEPVHSSGGVPPLSPPEAAGGPVGADPAWRRLRWRPDGGPP